MNGKMLGHYRVGEQLGRGGMGEVYVADDLNLNRKVALKFLPDAFAGDPERMARFEREARMLASLNHPNIAAIYGLEQAEGKRFIVMELVEGETLAQRIGKGALPVEDALGICRQIAEGLEAAHEKGVIHRDLKPANVMITEGDKVKILDFGLAKALSDETQNVDSSQSPTLTEAMTRPGVILGTAAYMSPEQAKGKSVDKRADIWAFGCFLYECLTGKRAFEGETVTETLAAVLTREVEWEQVPAKMHHLLRRCLEKDPKKRLRDIGDAFALLESPQNTAPVKRSTLLLAWASIAILLAITVVVLALMQIRGPGPAEAMRFDITVPSMPNEYGMSISPDGRRVAFSAFSSESTPSLFLREIKSGTLRKIEGTDGARYPFWSPDSRSIGFATADKLQTVDVLTGTMRSLCVVGTLYAGGAWNSDDVIVFADFPKLYRISAEGGNPVVLRELDKTRNEVQHGFPFFLPDQRHYLYLVSSGSGAGRGDIHVGSIDSREDRKLLSGASMAVYANPGYILFQRDKELLAQKFDATKQTLSGQPALITDSLLVGLYGLAVFNASQNGLVIYRSGSKQVASQFVWFDRAGKQLGLAGKPATTYRSGFSLSPDGKLIAAPRPDPAAQRSDIWLIEWERNVTARLTNDPAAHASAVWSPDGHRIGYSSNRAGSWRLFVKNANGIGEEEALTPADAEWMKDWSKDGRFIAYGNSDGDLYALPLFGERKPILIAKSHPGGNMPKFSHDGKWVAYNSDETGTWQIYVVPFPEANQKWLISNSGGVQPCWRSDGKELYYLTLDGKMMAVDIKADNKIEPGIPRVLFDTGLAVDPTNNQYDVTADGKRFLLLKSVSESNPTPITVVLNWTSLLKK
jgi:serine/threonine protein kinase